jgi:uncharacterized membrane protein YuzA (DUF378 family)
MRRNAFPPTTWVAIILSVIGAINWGLVGLFDFNLVSALFGPMSTLSRIIYVLVGLSGIYLLVAAATAESRGAPPRSTV